jgi:hypothetical protein
MSFLRFSKYKELYITMLPLMTIYPTIVGINVGIALNNRNPSDKLINPYSNIIGYTSIGIITGLTYPISYPLFACYVLYNNNK